MLEILKGESAMSSRIVVFQNVEDIVDFINKAERYSYSMCMDCDKYVVDARSLLGVICLGICREIVLKIYEENCDDFLKDIEKYIAA